LSIYRLKLLHGGCGSRWVASTLNRYDPWLLTQSSMVRAKLVGAVRKLPAAGGGRKGGGGGSTLAWNAVRSDLHAGQASAAKKK
jgi:hypothetical protein